MAYVHGVTNLGDTNPAFFSEPGSGFFFSLNFFLIDLISGLDPSLDPGFAERPGWICRSLFFRGSDPDPVLFGEGTGSAAPLVLVVCNVCFSSLIWQT